CPAPRPWTNSPSWPRACRPFPRKRGRQTTNPTTKGTRKGTRKTPTTPESAPERRVPRPLFFGDAAHTCFSGSLRAQVAAQFLGQGEGQVLLGRGDRGDVPVTEPGELVEQLPDQDVGDRGAAGHTDCGDVLQPRLVHQGGVVDEVGGVRAGVEGHLHQ